MNKRVAQVLVFWTVFIGCSVWDFYRYLLGMKLTNWGFWFNIAVATITVPSLGKEE